MSTWNVIVTSMPKGALDARGLLLPGWRGTIEAETDTQAAVAAMDMVRAQFPDETAELDLKAVAVQQRSPA